MTDWMAVVDRLYPQSNNGIGSTQNPWQNPPLTLITLWLVSGVIESFDLELQSASLSLGLFCPHMAPPTCLYLHIASSHVSGSHSIIL